MRTLTTCIVGGGNASHVLIPLLSEAGHQVHLWTRRPDDWQDQITCQVQDGRTGVTTQVHHGRIAKKSSDPSEVIPDADVIILCLPVHAYRPALTQLAPFISRDKDEVFVGTIFGQAGFNWMVHGDVERPHNLTNVVTFAIGSIPWICRTAEYGRAGINYGPKNVNTVAVTPRDRFFRLNDIFLHDISVRPYRKGKFELAEFMDLTLSVDNQILHPARCYGLWKRYGGRWATEEEVPYFYRDFDRLSADILVRLDDEYTLIRSALKKRFPDRTFTYMLSYLELENLNHQSGQVDVLSSLRDSVQLASIRTPVVRVEGENGVANATYQLNTQCRFFTDDIPYGLLIAKWLAEELGVQNTPMIDEVIQWAQERRGEAFLDPETKKINRAYCLAERYRCGIPESYGINQLSDALD